MTFGSSWLNQDGTLALPDLVQVVRVLNAQSGRFRLSVAGPLGTRTTADLDFDATAADVQDALEAIVGAGNVLVTKAGGTWVISYRGALAGAAGWARTIGMVTTWTDASPQLVAVAGKTLVTTATAMTDGWIDYTGFENLLLALGGGNDVLNVDGTPGPTTITTGAGNDVVMIETVAAATTVDAGAGDDILVLNPVVVAGEPSGLGGDLNLVGGFGSDYFLVGLWSQLTRKVTITDGFRLPSNPDNDTNILNVSGSLGADTFLFRRNLIALLNTKNSAGAFTAAEMVVYDGAINGGVIVNGLDGDDFFAFDDTSTFMTVNGDSGNDKFYVGQILTNYTTTSIYGIPVGTGSRRPPLRRQLLRLHPRLADQRRVQRRRRSTAAPATTCSTSSATRSTLTLNGEDGDDTFIVRTFVAELRAHQACHSGVGRDVIQLRDERAGRDRRRRRLRHRDRRRHGVRRQLRDHQRRRVRRRPVHQLRQRRAARRGRHGGQRQVLRPVHEPQRRDPHRRRPGQRHRRDRRPRTRRPGRRPARPQRHRHRLHRVGHRRLERASRSTASPPTSPTPRRPWS